VCGRYTSTSAPADLARVFDVDEIVQQIKVTPLPLRYNVAPTQDVYAVATRRPKEDEGPPRRVLGAFRWGLIPYWAKSPAAGNKMINARAEGIETKNAYKRALVRRRCIIPADGFYEWQVRQGNAKGSAKKKNKLPYIIRHKDGSPLAFAGLWELWRPPGQPGAEPIRSCVIITTAANDVVAPIHDRMPVILPPQAWATWLDPANEDLTSIQARLVPAPSGDFEVFPVGTRVNDVANEGPELVAPLPMPPAFMDGIEPLPLPLAHGAQEPPARQPQARR
jgi:putative SOS response-associated peptidase YedK